MSVLQLITLTIICTNNINTMNTNAIVCVFTTID